MTSYLVGRNPDISGPHIIVSGDSTISSRHCRISSLGNGTYKLDDEASTNGTFVRDQGGWRRVTSVKVGADDPVRLGTYVTTVSQLLRNAVDTKSKFKVSRNPKTGEIEHR
jgi:predicted component of type VI protein secretion system